MSGEVATGPRRHPPFVPVPSHLAAWLGPLDWFDDDPYIEGDLICPCGAWQFEFYYPGKTHHASGLAEPIPCEVEVPDAAGGSDFVFGVDAVCITCRGRVSVFDSENHGRQLVPTRGNRPALERAGSVPWKCPACGSLSHRGRAHFRFLWREEFLEEFKGVCGGEQWGDAFHWFGIAIQCYGCGHRVDKWAGYEAG
jgi:hypothetical protein